MTRARSIIRYCKACYGDTSSASRCELVACPLYRYRMHGEDASAPGERLTRGKAIRRFCVDCHCGQTASVRECPSRSCELYPYRMGKNPAT